MALRKSTGDAKSVTPPVSDAREIGFAIIGCGVISAAHASAVAQIPGARLVAVVDEQKERAQNLARGYREALAEYGTSKSTNAAPVIYTNYKAMLRRDDVDVVCVCVPSGFHAAVGVDVARAGKHIITEKPLEITLAKMDALINAARENNVKLATIFQRRFFPNSIRIKEAVESGKFGKILQCDCSIKWYRAQEYYDSGDWRGTWALDGGGCLMNQGVHGVDMLQWLGGPVAWVQAWCGTVDRKNIEVETQQMAIIGFRNGAHGTLQSSTICYGGEPVINQVFGSKGSASLHDMKLETWKFMKETAADKEMLETANSPDSAPTGLGAGSIHLPQLRDMVDAIHADREPSCTGEDARHSVEIILAVYESGRRGGEKIHLPLAHDFEARNFPPDEKPPARKKTANK